MILGKLAVATAAVFILMDFLFSGNMRNNFFDIVISCFN
jgi:hypothetical protein